ncbi:hypothetical protein TREPR_3291 [Treponema primitia ZAS-2]|uniref:Uncharacterized protein n=1 Tax=Treponema primitia (strain ATCC BAA-887 / DSM 12427 / ZAS-2) TaxID=545694 RepID=F5YKC4_TREPZ|nr:hypothetical protein TREPR_3291 [Treponema primitia ZAS-2]
MFRCIRYFFIYIIAKGFPSREILNYFLFYPRQPGKPVFLQGNWVYRYFMQGNLLQRHYTFQMKRPPY